MERKYICAEAPLLPGTTLTVDNDDHIKHQLMFLHILADSLHV